MRTMTQTFVGILLSVSLFLPTLNGCEQQGPTERAGGTIDNAAEGANENLGEAKENIEDAAEELK